MSRPTSCGQWSLFKSSSTAKMATTNEAINLSRSRFIGKDSTKKWSFSRVFSQMGLWFFSLVLTCCWRERSGCQQQHVFLLSFVLHNFSLRSHPQINKLLFGNGTLCGPVSPEADVQVHSWLWWGSVSFLIMKNKVQYVHLYVRTVIRMPKTFPFDYFNRELTVKAFHFTISIENQATAQSVVSSALVYMRQSNIDSEAFPFNRVREQ